MVIHCSLYQTERVCIISPTINLQYESFELKVCKHRRPINQHTLVCMTMTEQKVHHMNTVSPGM